MRKVLIHLTDLSSIDEALALLNFQLFLSPQAHVKNLLAEKETRSATLGNFALLKVIHKNTQLSQVVSKLEEEIKPPKEIIAIPKAAPPNIDLFINQKLYTRNIKTGPTRCTPCSLYAPPQTYYAYQVCPIQGTSHTGTDSYIRATGSSPKEKALTLPHHQLFANRTTPSPISKTEKLSATHPRFFGKELAKSNQVTPANSLPSELATTA
ncbi:hypothetical protein DFP73DRAFT_596185 [Morchella snyderi]|nr:hypothetical protein DFP73DRAFT_596185 [Morchella snyderi]